MRLEIIKKGMGEAVIHPEEVITGQIGTWTILFRVGQQIEIGGEIRFTLPYLFGNPQIRDPQEVGYVSVHCDIPHRSLEVIEEEPWYSETQFMHSVMELSRQAEKDVNKRTTSPVGRNFRIKILENPLVSGNLVTLIYGDIFHGGPDGKILPSREKEWVNIFVTVDSDGKRKALHTGFYRIETIPRLRINSSPVKLLRADIPSITTSKDPLSLRILVYDGLTLQQNYPLNKILSYPSKYGKLADGYRGKIECQWGEQFSELKLTEKKPIHCLSIPPISPEQKFGVVSLVDRRSVLIAKSNPCIFKKDLCPPYHTYSLYWGDLHIMNGAFWTTQAWQPEDYYKYAVDTGLDLAAVTDICRETPLFDVDTKLTNDEWEHLKECSRNFYQPGEFVTFPAYEYNERSKGGDRNVYFLNEDEAELYCWDNLKYSTPKKLWEVLKNKKAMTIPHHPACTHIGQNWDHHSGEVQRLVEIYSEWGNSEGQGCSRALRVPTDYVNRSVQSALARGYRLGFIVSSDTHSGDVGEAAKVAVWAKALTREAIWEALWSRRCYGTTGPKIIIQFCLNGQAMGAELTMQKTKKRRHLQVTIIGTDIIKTVTILRNNRVLYTYQGSSQWEEFEYVDKENPRNLSLYPLLFYYLRVTQVDGEMAWASPIWIEQ